MRTTEKKRCRKCGLHVSIVIEGDTPVAQALREHLRVTCSGCNQGHLALWIPDSENDVETDPNRRLPVKVDEHE